MARWPRSWTLICLDCAETRNDLVAMQHHLIAHHNVTPDDLRGTVRESVSIRDVPGRWRARIFDVVGDLGGATVLSVYRVGSKYSNRGFLALPFGHNPGRGKPALTWKIGITQHAVHVYRSAAGQWEPDFGLVEPHEWDTKEACLKRARKLGMRYRLRLLVQE